MNTTAVIFRVDDEGEVFALFAELPADADGHYCTSYVHIGGNGSADYRACKPAWREAWPVTLPIWCLLCAFVGALIEWQVPRGSDDGPP